MNRRKFLGHAHALIGALLAGACQLILGIEPDKAIRAPGDASVSPDGEGTSGTAGGTNSAGGSVGGDAAGGSRGQTEGGSAGAQTGPVVIRDRLSALSEPKIATSSLGSVVIWREFGELDLELRSAVSLPGGAWSAPQRLDTRGKGQVEYARLAMDQNGNAFVVWIQSWMGADSVWVSNRPANGAWQEPRVLENLNQEAIEVELAIGSPDHIAAAWSQSDGQHLSIWVSRYSAGTWLAPELVEDDAQDATSPRVAVGANGDITVVWFERDMAHVNRYSGGSWGAAKAIESEPGPAIETLELAVGASAQGTAFSVWSRNGILRGSQYLPKVSGAWSGAETYANVEVFRGAPRVQMDASGNALLVWSARAIESQQVRVKARRYSADAGAGTWEREVFVDEEALPLLPGESGQMAVAMNSQGQAVAVWESTNGTAHSVAMNRFDGQRWQSRKTLADVSSTYGIGPALEIAIDDAGHATALWLQPAGDSQVLTAMQVR